MIMLDGLRRFNSIGDKEGIYKFAQAVLSNDKTDEKAVSAMCCFWDRGNVNLKAAVALFAYLQLVTVTGTKICPTKKGHRIYFGVLPPVFLNSLSSLCLTTIISDGIVGCDTVHYEEMGGYFYIHRSGIPLSGAVFRNLLIELGAISLDCFGNYKVMQGLEDEFICQVQKLQRKLTQEQLLEQLELLRMQGQDGEQFALQYEKKRLGKHPCVTKVRLISGIDVAAGYDIVSYTGETSAKYDRFIEVKSYKGHPHFFWSENEVEQAKLKGGLYYIYLVDIDKINQVGYVPGIICNPAKEILDNPAWLVSPASYEVRKLEI